MAKILFKNQTTFDKWVGSYSKLELIDSLDNEENLKLEINRLFSSALSKTPPEQFPTLFIFTILEKSDGSADIDGEWVYLSDFTWY